MLRSGGSLLLSILFKVFVGSVCSVPGNPLLKLNGSYKHQDSVIYQDNLGQAVLELCKIIPFGVLCFFPSYGLLEKVKSRWIATGLYERLNEVCQVKDVVVEPRTGEDFDRAMGSYYDAIARSKGEPLRQTAKKTAGQNFFKKAKQKDQPAGKAKTGAIFLAVCRGKVSEGIDLADDNARGVIVVGIPYPNAMDNKEMQQTR
eukprot:746864-Hanusia_phi.AAC.4